MKLRLAEQIATPKDHCSYPPYFHPGYQFVDALDSLIRMITVGRTVPLRLLPCPVISGPTSGDGYKQVSQ